MKESFEKKLQNSKSGILPMDMKSEYISLTIIPVAVHKIF